MRNFFRLKCTKFGWGFVRDPADGAFRTSPRFSSCKGGGRRERERL